MNRTEILCKVRWNSQSVSHSQLTGGKAQDSAAGFACLCPTQYSESKFKGHSSLDHEPRADHSWKLLPQTLKCHMAGAATPPSASNLAQTHLDFTSLVLEKRTSPQEIIPGINNLH